MCLLGSSLPSGSSPESLTPTSSDCGDMDDGSVRRGDYRTARIGAAAGLIFAAVVTVLISSFSETSRVDPVVLGLLVGGGATLLGVEIVLPPWNTRG